MDRPPCFLINVFSELLLSYHNLGDSKNSGIQKALLLESVNRGFGIQDPAKIRDLAVEETGVH